MSIYLSEIAIIIQAAFIIVFQIWDGITKDLLHSLVTSPADVEVLRIYLTLPHYHEFANSKNYEKLHSPFSRAVLNLKDIPKTIISNWWANQSNEYFECLVEKFKGVVMYIIGIELKKVGAGSKAMFETHLELALKTLALLSNINDSKRAKRIRYEQFYLPELLDFMDLQSDYVHWVAEKVIVFITLLRMLIDSKCWLFLIRKSN